MVCFGTRQMKEEQKERQWLHITYRRDIWKKHIWRTSLLQIQGSRDPSLRNKLHGRSESAAQGNHFIYLLKFHKILMSEPLTKPCASDLQGLWINFLANIMQGGAQATGSSHHHITLQNSINSSLKPCMSYIREKKVRSWLLSMSDVYQRFVSTKTTLEFLKKKKNTDNFLIQKIVSWKDKFEFILADKRALI